MDDSAMLDFKKELEALGRIRDELKLKAHLAQAEVKSRLDDLERKWRLADEKVQRAKSHAKQDAATLQGEVKELITDLKQGYQDVKRTFQ